MIIMSSAASLLGLFSRRGYAAAASASAAISRIQVSSIPNYIFSRTAGVHTTTVSGESPPPPPPQRSKTSSPWLMLPPTFAGGDMIYKFYSLADDKVLTFNKGAAPAAAANNPYEEMPYHEADFVGSSHGWLVFFNRSDKKIFLSNPVSRRHIKLPPIDTLPIPESNYKGGYGCVNNVIVTSSSFDDENCRAVMTFGPPDRLAFCVPNKSLEWTPIGGACYHSFVHSAKQNLFYTIDQHDEFEAWDLRDPRSPRRIAMDDVAIEDGKTLSSSHADAHTWPREFLVVAEHSDELYLVRQFVMERMGPDGLNVESIYYGPKTGFSDDDVPDRTVGFDVHRYDLVDRVFKYIDPTCNGGPHKYDPEIKAFKYSGTGGGSSLDGLAFFIGANHGFALRASEYPGLKPNSIYYTCSGDTAPNSIFPVETDIGSCGGHDMGIFNYEDGTFSSCYYPRDYESIQMIQPTPMWFTPS